MTGIRPPVPPSGKGSPCAPGDEARHEIMDLSGTPTASPRLSLCVHAYMDGLIPWGTSILGYSDSRASLCRPGTDAMVAMGEFRPQVMGPFYHAPSRRRASPIVLFRE